MEFKRAGESIPAWEPFCWEASSAVMILLLIPFGILFSDRWLNNFSLKTRLLFHALATIPFSSIHVAGMVGI
jgi:glycopeptide antibiotics resistance protein